MTQEQINELRKLAEDATPGPWIKRGYVPGIGCGVDGVTAVAHHTTSADADFIAAANPAAILALIQQRDELLAALKLAEESIGRFTSDEGSTQHDFDVADAVYAAISNAGQ